MNYQSEIRNVAGVGFLGVATDDDACLQELGPFTEIWTAELKADPQISSREDEPPE